jgi:hypothetical protein
MRDFIEMRFGAIRAAFDAASQSAALKRVKEWSGPPSASMPPVPK